MIPWGDLGPVRWTPAPAVWLFVLAIGDSQMVALVEHYFVSPPTPELFRRHSLV